MRGDDGLTGLPDPAVLRLAADLEGHADNVAACQAGGLTIAWTAGGSRAADPAESRLPGLAPVLCVPAVPLATEAARKVLPATVPHADAAANSARAALLIAALTGDGRLLFDATEDFLHQRYRASAMPASAGLVAGLRAEYIPAVLSGAGPSVLALLVSGVTPGPEAVAAIAAATGEEWSLQMLAVDQAGASVLRPTSEMAAGMPV